MKLQSRLLVPSAISNKQTKASSQKKAARIRLDEENQSQMDAALISIIAEHTCNSIKRI